MSEERSTHKFYPKWDATEETWPRFKVEMEGAIASQTKYSDYLSALHDDTYEILKTGVASTENAEDERNLEYKLSRNDVELFNVLVSCIPNTTGGNMMHQLVLGAKNMDYKNGSFKKAWQRLTKKNEQKITTKKDNLLKMYLNSRMTENEVPFNFVMKISELRRLLGQNHGYKIDEDEYLQDILKKLPSNYRTKKLEIQQMIKDREVKDDLDMVEELTQECAELFPNQVRNGTQLQDEHKDGPDAAMFGQFKGKCNHCGQCGHMRKDCPDKKNGVKNNKGGGNSHNNRNNNGNNKKETRPCFFCGIKGHLKKDCRQRKAKLAEKARESDSAAISFEDIGDVVLTTAVWPMKMLPEKKVMTCGSCCKAAHTLAECPNPTQTEKPQHSWASLCESDSDDDESSMGSFEDGLDPIKSIPLKIYTECNWSEPTNPEAHLFPMPVEDIPWTKNGCAEGNSHDDSGEETHNQWLVEKHKELETLKELDCLVSTETDSENSMSSTKSPVIPAPDEVAGLLALARSLNLEPRQVDITQAYQQAGFHERIEEGVTVFTNDYDDPSSPGEDNEETSGSDVSVETEDSGDPLEEVLGWPQDEGSSAEASFISSDDGSAIPDLIEVPSVRPIVSYDSTELQETGREEGSPPPLLEQWAPIVDDSSEDNSQVDEQNVAVIIPNDDDSDDESLPSLHSRGNDTYSSSSSSESDSSHMSRLTRNRFGCRDSESESSEDSDDDSIGSVPEARMWRVTAEPRSDDEDSIGSEGESAALFTSPGDFQKNAPNLWLADSGATSHMGPTDAGMFSARPGTGTVKVGNGDNCPVRKIGKKKSTVVQSDGSKLDVVLQEYKQVPDLWVHLFSITKAVSDGWKLSNEGQMMVLTKGKNKIVFDRIIKSGSGHLCAVEIRPPGQETATAAMDPGSTVNIQEFHETMGHTSEESLRLTAKAMGVKPQGSLQACESCHVTKARKKNVPKKTDSQSESPGERLLLDISSSTAPSYGGRNHWLLAEDDCTTRIWSYFLRQKNELCPVMLVLIRQLRKAGHTVKFIRMDNAGENQTLAKEIKESQDLNDITVEFTPPGTPQYNGKPERMFQTLWGRSNAQLNAAQLPQRMRDGLWPESARLATFVQNNLVTPRFQDIGSPYKQFHGTDWKGGPNLHRFGHIGVVTTAKKIKAKQKDKGTCMLYLGPAEDHAADVHRFFNPNTRKIVMSRDVKWLNKSYGVWKGLIKPTVTPATTPAEVIKDDPSQSTAVRFQLQEDTTAPPTPPTPPVPPVQS